eukprot:1157708-Pelagomonas_calceolata.AAC.5
MHYADLGPSRDVLRRLWAAVQALYLELGACAVSGGFGTAGLAAIPAMDAVSGDTASLAALLLVDGGAWDFLEHALLPLKECMQELIQFSPCFVDLLPGSAPVGG